MIYKYFTSLPSTQSYLQQNLIDDPDELPDELIVATHKQSAGRGRSGKSWLSVENSIALSFTQPLTDRPTLTAAEIGVLIAHFVKERLGTEVFLKWPNDLLNDKRQKVGGILIQVKNNMAICGVGINLYFSNSPENMSYPIGHLGYRKLDPLLPLELAKFCKNHRPSENEIEQKWSRRCVHLNQQVRIVDDKKTVEGIFLRLGPSGEALIQTPSGEVSVFTGSLFLC